MIVKSSLACDVCGCAVSGTNGDVIPGIFSNYIGLGSSLRSFSSTHLTLFDNEVPIQSTENFGLVNIHGRYSPFRRLQIYGNLPISSVQKKEENEIRYTSGLSDASIRTNYLVVDKKKDSTLSFFNVFVGATLKMPTGRHEFKKGEKYYFHRNMLPGSGTFDVGLHLDAIYRKKSNGIALYGTKLFRGQLNDEYDFGDFYHSRFSAFHFFEFKKSSLMLDVGADFTLYEQDLNLRSNTIEEFTGGWMLSPTLRINYNTEKVIFSATALRPIAQQLANNQVTNNYSIQLNVIYIIN